MLPGGSLLEYAQSQEGLFSVGFSYEHEQLDFPIYGSTPIPNYNRERTNSSSLTFITNYGVTNQFSLTAFFPFRYILNEKVLFRGQNDNVYHGGKYFRETYGLGDVVIQARYQLLLLHQYSFVISAGVKLGNGKINGTDEYGDRISDILQVGTGTVDPVFSIYTSRDVSKFVVSGGVFTRITNGENIYGYRYGNELQSLINLDYIEKDLVYGGIQFSHLLTTRDYYEYGKVARDRGGESYFLAGKLGTRATNQIDFELTIQVPLYQYLNESQLTSPFIIQLGSLWRLSS